MPRMRLLDTLGQSRRSEVGQLHALRLDHRPSVGLSSNLEPMGPPVDGYRQLMRMGVIHPIPVPFMEQRELRKGRIAQRSAVDL
jgi:hypothetical protein